MEASTLQQITLFNKGINEAPFEFFLQTDETSNGYAKSYPDNEEEEGTPIGEKFGGNVKSYSTENNSFF